MCGPWECVRLWKSSGECGGGKPDDPPETDELQDRHPAP
jgi:hypothetical protein